MARSTQKPNGATQRYGTQRSRASNNQSQTRRSKHVEEEEEDENMDEDEEGEGQLGSQEGVDQEIGRKANLLVRIALFNESKRTPLKRDEINKKVMGDNTRPFPKVFEAAQKILRDVFGMELAELMSRSEREQQQTKVGEDRGDENSTGIKKKESGSGPKQFILRSVLHDSVVEQAVEVFEDLQEAEMQDSLYIDDDAPQPAGTILSWNTSDQLNGIGILYVVLALILVNGHSLKDIDLKRHLKALKCPMTAAIDFPPHHSNRTMTVESYLHVLVKQGHLDAVQVTAGAQKATQVKRPRASEVEGYTGNIEWRWGSRAYSEVGERAIADFVASFMAEHSARNTGGVEHRNRARNREEIEKTHGTIMRDITRAAGGSLSEVR